MHTEFPVLGDDACIMGFVYHLISRELSFYYKINVFLLKPEIQVPKAVVPIKVN